MRHRDGFDFGDVAAVVVPSEDGASADLATVVESVYLAGQHLETAGFTLVLLPPSTELITRRRLVASPTKGKAMKPTQTATNVYTGSVRLIDRKARVVELLGPELAGSRRPTDIELMWEPYGPAPGRPVGFCIRAKSRRARFHINDGPLGDSLLDFLERRRGQSQLARPWGVRGWMVEEYPRLDRSANRTVSQRPDEKGGGIYYSRQAGQILSVNGKPVKRSEGGVFSHEKAAGEHSAHPGRKCARSGQGLPPLRGVEACR